MEIFIMPFAISMATLIIVAFFIGIYWERLRWNNLIERGILPEPPKRR
jgi:hypothetical protein